MNNERAYYVASWEAAIGNGEDTPVVVVKAGYSCHWTPAGARRAALANQVSGCAAWVEGPFALEDHVDTSNIRD